MKHKKDIEAQALQQTNAVQAALLAKKRAQYRKYIAPFREYCRHKGRNNMRSIPSNSNGIGNDYILDMLGYDPAVLNGLAVTLPNDEFNPLENEPLPRFRGIIHRVDTRSNEITVRISGGNCHPSFTSILPDLTEDEIIMRYPDMGKIIKEAGQQAIKTAVERIEHRANETINYKKRDLLSQEADLLYHQNQIVVGKQAIKTLKLFLKEAKPCTYTLDNLKAEVDKIATQSKIETAYLTADGSIAILTKPLQAIDPISKATTDFNVGRFYLKLQFYGGSVQLTAYNRDFVAFRESGIKDPHATRYYHPNVKQGSVCLGDHSYVVADYLAKGHFYIAVDFLMTFLSTYPHHDGSPYMNFELWKLTRIAKTDRQDKAMYTIPEVGKF